jgi:prepilin peptidase CpaA
LSVTFIRLDGADDVMIDFFGAVLFLLISLAALQDIQCRRIPNTIIVSIAVLWIAYTYWNPASDTLASLGVAAAVLAIGMLCWCLRWIGGGDVKLIAALGLWAGPQHTLPMVATIALAGGMLASILALARKPAVTLLLTHVAMLRGGPQVGGSAAARNSSHAWAAGWPNGADPLSVPYGVAIAAGGYWLIHRLFVG